MSTELAKPCAKCGGTNAIIYAWRDEFRPVCRMPHCDARWGAFTTEAAAIEAWNRRPPTSPDESIREVIREWKFAWAAQADYRRAAWGIDANMCADLAERIEAYLRSRSAK